MQAYLDLLHDVIKNGSIRDDRTKTGTIAVFGRQIRFDLQSGFPILTTKSVHFKSVVHELLWFLKGSTNLDYLQAHKVKIWDAWADEAGDLGPIYGKQWRSWDGIHGQVDQIKTVIETIRQRPHSRRLIVNAWRVDQLPDEGVSAQQNVQMGKMALAPCHCLFQFFVEQNKLSCLLYQRSADLFLGVPFNIASYALLTHLIAAQTGLEVNEFIHTFGDLHLYKDHLTEEIVYEQLRRKPLPLPQLIIKPRSSIDDYVFEDIHLDDYQHHSAIKALISI